MTLNANWFLNATGQFQQIGSGQIGISTTTTTGFLTFVTATLTSSVNLSTAGYTDGPSAAQGSSGTWFASGIVNLSNGTAGEFIFLKLWDGVTVASAAAVQVAGGMGSLSMPLSGVIANPAGNIRISGTINSSGATAGFSASNSISGSSSQFCTITAIRIG